MSVSSTSLINKKTSSLTLLVLIFCLQTVGQDQNFMHSLGITGLSSIDRSITRGGLTYSPRYNFIEFSEHASISLGGHFTAWFDFWDEAGGHTLHLPFVLEGNFGNAATLNGDFPFGAFIGGGVGYNNMYSDEGNSALGPAATFGIRTSFQDKDSWTTRFSFLMDMGAPSQDSVIGIGISYNFGEFD